MHQLPPLTAHEIVSAGLPVVAVIFFAAAATSVHVDSSGSGRQARLLERGGVVEQDRGGEDVRHAVRLALPVAEGRGPRVIGVRACEMLVDGIGADHRVEGTGTQLVDGEVERVEGQLRHVGRGSGEQLGLHAARRSASRGRCSLRWLGFDIDVGMFGLEVGDQSGDGVRPRTCLCQVVGLEGDLDLLVCGELRDVWLPTVLACEVPEQPARARAAVPAAMVSAIERRGRTIFPWLLGWVGAAGSGLGPEYGEEREARPMRRAGRSWNCGGMLRVRLPFEAAAACAVRRGGGSWLRR